MRVLAIVGGLALVCYTANYNLFGTFVGFVMLTWGMGHE